MEHPLDHFSFGGRGSQQTYRERYYFCDQYWNTTASIKVRGSGTPGTMH